MHSIKKITGIVYINDIVSSIQGDIIGLHDDIAFICSTLDEDFRIHEINILTGVTRSAVINMRIQSDDLLFADEKFIYIGDYKYLLIIDRIDFEVVQIYMGRHSVCGFDMSGRRIINRAYNSDGYCWSDLSGKLIDCENDNGEVRLLGNTLVYIYDKLRCDYVINNNIITMTPAMYAKTSHIKNGKIFKKCVRA